MDDHKEHVPEKEEELQPELKDIIDSINRFVAANEGRVVFVASFMGLDVRCEECAKKAGKEEIEIPDRKSRLMAFGDIEGVRILLNELRDVVEDEKDPEDDFVNL